MKRLTIFLVGLLFVFELVSCTKAPVIDNNPTNEIIEEINEPDTVISDSHDINGNPDSNGDSQEKIINPDSNDDSKDLAVLEDPILDKYKESLDVSTEKCTLFDIGFENPVFIVIDGNYWIYGMDKDGNVKEIDSLVKDTHSAQYWLREGEPIIISSMTIGNGEAVSTKCVKIEEDFSVIEEYEIREIYATGGSKRRYDENGTLLFDTELYFEGVKQDIAPEEYEGYVPIDDSFIEISELFIK